MKGYNKTILAIVITTLMIGSILGSLFTFVVTASPRTNQTVDIYSSGTYDGYIYAQNANYNTARNAASGTVDDQGSLMKIGCLYYTSSNTWKISRGFLFFDTSGLANNANILSVKLHIYVHSVCNDQSGSDLVLFNGQPTYPNKPMISSDFNKNNYNDVGISSFHISISDEFSWATWTWASDAYDVITKGGWTKICLRTLDDKNGVQDEYDEISMSSGDDSTYKPYLEIEYTIPPQPTITFYTDPSNIGSITFDGSTYTNGQSTQKTNGDYTATGNPSSGYIFYQWTTTGGVSVSNPNSQTTTVTISGDGSLKAQFKILRTITFYTDPTNGGTIKFDGTNYNNGETTQKIDGTYSITGNPSTDYSFNHWSSTGGISVTNPNSQTTTATVTGDGSLKAYFNYNPPQPILYIYPTSLDFGQHYQGWTGSTTFQIANTGNGELQYSITENIDWIQVSPMSGSCPPTHGDTITVSVVNTGNMNGDYNGVITINSNGGDGTVNVHIKISPPAKWTVIAYLCGDQNLEGWCAASLAFMSEVGSQFGSFEIVALYDGSGNGDTHAYHVLHNDLENIPWANEVDMGDPNTLISFSTYCINNYPAERYIIIPQDHGASWAGCCFDDSGDFLDMNDLHTAFQHISDTIGKKVDLVFFNDCLMNSIEIGYQLEPFIKYQAGSETVSSTDTCDDEYVNIIQYISSNLDTDTGTIAKKIIEYEQPCDDNVLRTQSISTIDSSKIQQLASLVNSLALDLKGKLDQNKYINEIKTARDNCEYTRGPYGQDIEQIIDLYDFADKIKTNVPDTQIKSEAQSIMDLIGPDGGQDGKAITKERHTTSASFCNGISIYFPDRADRYKAEYLTGNNFVKDTNWDEFLLKFLAVAADGSNGWDAHIKVTKDTEDRYLIFGEDVKGSDGYDPNLDVSYPGSYANIGLCSEISQKFYSVDIRQYPGVDQQWNVILYWEGESSATFKFTWDVSSIPHTEYSSIILHDPDGNKDIDMRTSSSYSITISPGARFLYIKCISAPETPKIVGPASGSRGKEYDYKFVSTDPKGQDIYYRIDWSDGNIEKTDFVHSGVEVTISHTWAKKGTYTVKAKAIDTDGYESDWGQLKVSMPRNRAIYNLLFRLFERFPVLERLLNLL